MFHTICDELLLFIAVNVTAILPGQVNFYLFDSHSRDDKGLYVSDGAPVLLRLVTFKIWIGILKLHTRNL